MKPKEKIALFNIQSINRITIDHTSKNRKYHHFFLELINTTNSRYDIRHSLADNTDSIITHNFLEINRSIAEMVKQNNSYSRKHTNGDNHKDSFNSSMTEKRSCKMSSLDDSRGENLNQSKLRENLNHIGK
jgi:hypothetical protein